MVCDLFVSFTEQNVSPLVKPGAPILTPQSVLSGRPAPAGGSTCCVFQVCAWLSHAGLRPTAGSRPCVVSGGVVGRLLHGAMLGGLSLSLSAVWTWGSGVQG